jgi:hypothetical protein
VLRALGLNQLPPHAISALKYLFCSHHKLANFNKRHSISDSRKPRGKKVNKLSFSSIVVTLAMGLLSGCGGGGGDSATTTATATATINFPLLSGYKARIATGSTDNFIVSGTCSGTATLTNGAATAGTFQSVVGYTVVQTTTANLTNCTPSSNATTGTGYYDSNYSPLGSQVLGTEFTKYITLPPALPSSVKVGDTAAYATQNVFTDSTMATATGQRFISYVIEADSSSTAIVNLITKSYSRVGQLLYTQQSRYRIAEDGFLTIVSIEIQYSTYSLTRLLYTKS